MNLTASQASPHRCSAQHAPWPFQICAIPPHYDAFPPSAAVLDGLDTGRHPCALRNTEHPTAGYSTRRSPPRYATAVHRFARSFPPPERSAEGAIRTFCSHLVGLFAPGSHLLSPTVQALRTFSGSRTTARAPSTNQPTSPSANRPPSLRSNQYPPALFSTATFSTPLRIK